jgi:uncharacterized protein DUF4399
VRRTARSIVILFVLGLVAAACSNEPAQSLEIADPPASIDGNVATLEATVEGIEIVKADGDTSGDSGHFHAFIDKEPVAVGETIPKEPGIVHTPDNPIKLWGLSVGDHTVKVVIGDGAHKRIGEELEEEVTFEVTGPSVDGTAPATIKEGDDVTVELKAEGVEIVKADGDESGDSGHFHVLVDPADPPKAGAVVPPAAENSPYAAQIIHTPDSSVTISGLKKGEHTLWVLLGNGAHKAFDPPVMDKLTVTVE